MRLNWHATTHASDATKNLFDGRSSSAKWNLAKYNMLNIRRASLMADLSKNAHSLSTASHQLETNFTMAKRTALLTILQQIQTLQDQSKRISNTFPDKLHRSPLYTCQNLGNNSPDKRHRGTVKTS